MNTRRFLTFICVIIALLCMISNVASAEETIDAKTEKQLSEMAQEAVDLAVLLTDNELLLAYSAAEDGRIPDNAPACVERYVEKGYVLGKATPYKHDSRIDEDVSYDLVFFPLPEKMNDLNKWKEYYFSLFADDRWGMLNALVIENGNLYITQPGSTYICGIDWMPDWSTFTIDSVSQNAIIAKMRDLNYIDDDSVWDTVEFKKTDDGWRFARCELTDVLGHDRAAYFPAPQTGEHTVLYAFAAISALSALAALCVRRKKKAIG